MMFVIGDTI